MIPDHLIDQAAAAIYASSAFGDEFAYDAWRDMNDNSPIKTTTRAYARAALESTAAHFWDEGEEVGYVHGQHDAHRFDPGPDYTETPNPYKETA